jgi:hypothetical protein
VTRTRPEIPPDIEDHRDAHWRREGMRQVETALDAERFIEQAGFAACLTDCRNRERRSTWPSADAAMR